MDHHEESLAAGFARDGGRTVDIDDRGLRDLPVLFRTRHEIVIVKPAGIASELSSDPRGVSILSRIRAEEPASASIRLPHRLDRVTRGLLVVALSPDAIRFHNEEIRARRWAKLYLARAHAPTEGAPEGLIGMHRLYLRTRGGRAMIVRSGGRPAWTEILAAEPAPDALGVLHLAIQLHTGRTHQIRATLAHLGVPLCGDWLYGREGGAEATFYLEHTALRFTPYGAGEPITLHWSDDPTRPPLGDALRRKLDAVLRSWENGGR